VSGQVHAPAALYPRETPGTHVTGGLPIYSREPKITAFLWNVVSYASTKFREIRPNLAKVRLESTGKERKQDSGEGKLSGLGMNTEARLLFSTNLP